MSDSVRSYRRQPTRLPRPWDSPGKNTGVGCHFLLQCMKWKAKMKSLSCVQLFTTPWTAAHQAPPSMGFSRQEYWSGVPSPSPVKIVISHLFCNLFHLKTWSSKYLHIWRNSDILQHDSSALSHLIYYMFSFYKLTSSCPDFFSVGTGCYMDVWLWDSCGKSKGFDHSM